MATRDDTRIEEENDSPEIDPAANFLLKLSESLDSLNKKMEKITNERGAYPELPPARKRRAIELEEQDEEDIPCSEISEEELETVEDKGTKKSQTFNISSPTKAFLQTSFCLPKPVDNTVRREWLERYGLPVGNEARCPKMDSIIKGELGKEALETDRKLSRLQNFSLDAIGPLVVAMEELTEKEEPDVSVVTAAVQQGLRFLGNCSAHFSQERRAKALAKLNPDLKCMAEDEDFTQAPPFLFGAGFEKKAKERTEALECLRKASNSKSSSISAPTTRKFFQGNRFHRGGGGSGNQYRHSRTQRSFRPFKPNPTAIRSSAKKAN